MSKHTNGSSAGLSDNLELSRGRPERSYRETFDVVAGVCRLITAVGKRLSDEDPEDLLQLRAIQDNLDAVWAEAVAGIRRSGFSDRDIGDVLGVTKQAVQKRWPR